ncbi:MAG TPA: hypothetical protein VGM84_01510 [Steroidobacteraceae bacterium]|jgi:hypothetical protein
MSSQSRNNRKLLALPLALAAAAVAASVAHAADPSKFVLTAYTASAGGPQIASGSFDAAIDQIALKSKAPGADLTALKNNECVAYAMKSDFTAAHDSCSAAINEARRELSRQTGAHLWERQVYSEYLAIAYSNRAVVDWLQQDSARAAQDLASANGMNPQGKYVSQNLSALHSPHENAVAQVDVTPKR